MQPKPTQGRNKMRNFKLNGIIKEVIEQGPNGDVAGLLQERLQIPLDKAEELAKRIQKDCKFEETPIELQKDQTMEDSNPNPKATSYSIEALSEREFERFMKWLLEELGFEIQADQPVDVGVNFVAAKGVEKTCIHARKCPLNLKIADSTVLDVNQAKQINECSQSIVAATSFFSEQAILCAEKLDIELWDRNTIIQKIEEAQNKTELEEQSCFPPYRRSLLESLLELEKTKDFIIEPKADGKYELHLPGIRHPLLSFQALGEEVVRCVFRIKYNEPVGEFEGEVLIGYNDAEEQFGPDGQDAYAAILEYLGQFVE
jgi:hypothetical protein